MARNQQSDLGITGVQKLITLSMLAFMGYLFFSQEQENKVILPATTTAEIKPIKVQITDTKTGVVNQSDLSAGKIILGKWEIELAKDEPEAPKPAETEAQAEKSSESKEKPAEEDPKPETNN